MTFSSPRPPSLDSLDSLGRARTDGRLGRRLLAAVAFIGGGALLGGCPIYDDDSYYYSSGGTHASCAAPACCSTSYDCPSGYACEDRVCKSVGGSCSSPAACGPGYVCGADSKCHPGTCQTHGCVGDHTCTLTGGEMQCVKNPAPGGDAGTDAGPPPECSSDATCVTTLGAGAKCLSGSCVAPADQCSDATQCTGSSQCVDGVCTPTCGTSRPCPAGYSCDENSVCTGNPSPCTTSAQCSGSAVCVSGHCVAPCNGGTCAGGLVCVGGGCVPNQKPQFVCQTEGEKDACADGSICLHHSCYIACGVSDAGADAGTCQGADQFNVCKSVETSTGTYAVCGSATNLGTECDPTRNLACTGGKVCIDGFCR